jgi:hypothetical protein
MPFTDDEIARHVATIERILWSKRRPPLHLRDKVREGQRITGYTIELFMVRPMFAKRGQLYEDSIAKTRYIKSRKIWRVFWKRADLKWHAYQPRPRVKTLEAFLRLVDEDAYHCFWG